MDKRGSTTDLAGAQENVVALVQQRALPGSQVVFATVVGSRCYNLNRDGSDIDYAGVYAAPPSSFWGLSRPTPTLVSSNGGGGVDVQVSEVASFANLLLNGNPAAVELLWAEPDKQGCWWASVSCKAEEGSAGQPLGTWASLRQNRDMFLTQQFVKQCLAFAQGQIKQAETKPEVYNAIRLLRVAQGVVNRHSLRLWWEGDERESLMAIRRGGNATLPEALEVAKEAARALEALKPWASLPDKADAEWLEAWLVALRKHQLN